MTLVLNNDEIAELLPMADCLARLEETYRDLGEGRAASRPRAEIVGPSDERGRYIFKTMDGMTPRYEVAALRLNSDVIRWSEGSAGIRKDKQPVAGDGKWVGLVLLFSMRTGEPLAIMPDGVMQRLRVACTNAVAAKYMAAPDASVYALFGAGWQASGQALAMAQVRPLREMRIYSPTPANRERLAKQLAGELGIDVKAVDDPRACAHGADIVGMATNSVTPVVQADWVAPHAHVTSLKDLELGDGILERSAQVIVNARIDRPANYFVGRGEEPIFEHDPPEIMAGEMKKKRAARRPNAVDLTRQPNLGELVAGKVPAAPAGRMTCFVNTIGLGMQFAALGSLAHERARERGIGREIPTDWFLESVHP
ncbi:MAG TPA: ornithine cyclodeaminase family protein [Candidatus Binatia bacterium]|nr:ornithine cyclodeaminase family protein [Candidatus Binatia bacterium]